jgi:hypothetical protein
MMKFAKLCNHFKPDTLAKIVVDLGDGPFTNEIEEAQQTAMDALVANVGEKEARALIAKEAAS